MDMTTAYASVNNFFTTENFSSGMQAYLVDLEYPLERA